MRTRALFSLKSMLEARQYVIKGRVQGVGFRYFAEKWAERFSIRGYVRNTDAGDVEVYAIGTLNQLEAYKAKLEQGPHASRVTVVVETKADVDENWKYFRITF